MKAAVVSEILNTHSGSRAPIDLAVALSKLKNEVTIFGYTRNCDEILKRELEKKGLKISLFAQPKILASIKLFSALKKSKPQVINFHGTLHFFLAAKLTAIPLVKTYHGTQIDAYLEKIFPKNPSFSDKFLNFLVNKLVILIEKIQFNLADEIIAISKFASSQAKKLYGKKPKVIYNGGDWQTKNLPSTQKTSGQSILTVSRITPYKGFHLIIKALKKIKTKRRVTLTIAGSQPKEYYLKYLKKLGGKNLHIVLDPSDEELSKLYQQSDIYATADRYLYFGLPICEAAWFGKPTLTLDLAAAEELVQHKKTGFVAKNQDEFVFYLQKLINRPKLAKRMGLAAQNRARKMFNWGKTAQYYNNIFKQIIAKKSRKKYGLVALKLIVLTGLLLRALFLFHHDFWFDEAISYFIAKQDLKNLIFATAADNHPPFYYFILHFWMKFFGETAIAQRILSLLFGILSIPAIFWLGRLLFNPKVGLISSLILALSPLMIYFSTETRMYSLLVLLVLLTVILLQKFISKPSLVSAFGLIASFTLALYTNYYAYLLFIPFNVIFLLRRKHWARFVVCQAVILILAVPWLLIYFQNPHPVIFAQNLQIAIPATFSSFVLGGTGIVSLRQFFSLTQLFPTIIFTLLLITSAFIFLAGFPLLKKNQNSLRSSLNFLLLLLFSPLIPLVIISFFKPAFVVRSTIFLAPFFYLILAVSLRNLKKKPQILTILSLITLLLLTVYIQRTNPDFFGSPLEIASQELKGKRLILHTSVLTYYPFRYYHQNSSQDFLVTKNPLTPRTVSIIGGETSWPKDIVKEEIIYLINIKSGTEKAQEECVEKRLEKQFLVKSDKHFQDIEIRVLEAR